MKLERANKDIVKGYRRTKLLRFLDDFIKSDMDCAKVVYERGEYVKPWSCSNALSMAIKRYKYDKQMYDRRTLHWICSMLHELVSALGIRRIEMDRW